jgi:hypothetical protein
VGLGNYPPALTKTDFVVARTTQQIRPYHGVVFTGTGPTLQVRPANASDDQALVYFAGPVGVNPGASDASVRGTPGVGVSLRFPAVARVAPGQTLGPGSEVGLDASGRITTAVAEPGFIVLVSEALAGGPYYALIDRKGGAVESRKLIRFRMTSDLPLAGKGTAIEITSGPGYATVGSAFPIKDPWESPGSWRDDTGGSYRGFCYIPDNPELVDDAESPFDGQPYREIVWMEQIARFVNFTATQDTQLGATSSDPWTVTGTLDAFYFGKDPANAYEGAITFYDPQQLWPHIMQDAKGKARYNEQEHRYEIVIVNQMAHKLEATLVSDLCDQDSTAAVTGIKVASFSPFGMEPQVSTAQNIYHLCAPAGAKVQLDWYENLEDPAHDPQSPEDPATGFWVVTQVEHQEVMLPIDFRLVWDASAQCCRLEYKRIRVCLQTCDDIQQATWETVPGDAECCTADPPDDGCCGCPDAPLSLTSVMRITLTGALTGTVDLAQATPPGEACLFWEGTLTSPGGPCSSEFASLTISIRCFENSALPIQMQISGGGGGCAISDTSYIPPDTFSCGTELDPGITGEWTFTTRDTVAGDGSPCGCGTTINVSVEEVEP